MFQATKNEVLQRLQEADAHFRGVCPADVAVSAAISKGLLFVELYAVWEYSIRTAVQAGINELNNLGKPASALRPEILGIGLDESLNAMHDSDQTRNKWGRRLKFFQQLTAATPVSADASIMPTPGPGLAYRPAHLEIIWALFGIVAPIVPDNRLLGLITELIENRHAIAHGRRTAHDVGQRYTVSEMHKKLGDTRDACIHVLQSMEHHCSNAINLCRVP